MYCKIYVIKQPPSQGLLSRQLKKATKVPGIEVGHQSFQEIVSSLLLFYLLIC